MCPRSLVLPGRGVGTVRPPASRATTPSRTSRNSYEESSPPLAMARKGALDPSGLVLYDKPAGPSSFAIVRQLREQTGARAGHAGTLDPFATGLLLVLLGSFTKEAQRFVGLDKRYETDVDLTATTSTGDPEGETLEEHDAPSKDELLERLDALRGEVDLRV